MNLSARYFILSFNFSILLKLSNCKMFESIGIVHSPYMKHGENGTFPFRSTYFKDEVKATLSLTLSKFSKLTNYEVGAPNVSFIENDTYYKCEPQVFTAELLAQLGLQKKSKFPLLLGIFMKDPYPQMNTEILVALESASKANAILEGTVEGLVLSHHETGTTLSRARQVLMELDNLKKIISSQNLPLKLGTRQLKCPEIYNIATYVNKELVKVKLDILSKSDFIICQMEPNGQIISKSISDAYKSIKEDFLNVRTELQKINPNIQVMGETSWASKGLNHWEKSRNLVKYFEEMEAFSKEHNYPIYMLEALDQPWKTWAENAAYFGWWRLKENNSSLDEINGYEEKADDPQEEDVGSKATVIGIVIGCLIFIIISAVVAKLYLRVKKLESVLSSKEIKEFMYGIKDDAEIAAINSGAEVAAFKNPYNKAYEIDKSKLRFDKSDLLGAGQFGAVYKAIIEGENGVENVALKTTKDNCPKNTLKGMLSEIKIMSYLGGHPNIVGIVGAYTSELQKGIVYIATELCGLGSLQDYLRGQTSNYSNEGITIKDMIRWSHEIACGMEYLGVKNVVHADLATRNVMLDGDKTAKITDFGLSRRLYEYTEYVKQQQEPLPWRWMAIESLKRLEFTCMSDVWSYGVTLWEIFSFGDLPYPGLNWDVDFVNSLENGLRMKSPPKATTQIYELMVNCWHMEPLARPTFTNLKIVTGQLMTT